jgi:hypothetical protein
MKLFYITIFTITIFDLFCTECEEATVPVPMFFCFKKKFDNLFKIAVIILKSIYKQLAVMFLVTRKNKIYKK